MTPHEEAAERLAQDLIGDLDRLNRWQSAQPTTATDPTAEADDQETSTRGRTT